MKLIHYDDLIASPWKNGGGVTREVASGPAGAGLDNFSWRISIADVSRSGPFSVFPGIDRMIVLLDGGGMHLEFADGRVHELTEVLAPYRFRGEDPVHARVTRGASRDLNLMLRRDAADGKVEVWRRRRHVIWQGEMAVVLFCTSGSWEVIPTAGPRRTLCRQQMLSDEYPEGSASIVPLEPESTLVCIAVVRRLSKGTQNDI